MARRIRHYGLLLLLAFCLAGCSDRPSLIAGGGGVETTEGNLAGLAGSPAGARVQVIPAGFDPVRDTLPDSLTAIADAAGNFRIRGLVPGRYNVEAYQPKDGTRCFRAGVQLGKGARIPADTLAVPGRLRLRWDGARKGILHQRGRLFRASLAGLESDSGGVTLDSVPAGVLPPFSFVASTADTALKAWTDSVSVAPGTLSEVAAYGEWAHQASLSLDSAALTADTLADFPLLVRLARPAFDFSESAPDGADLRVTTAGGEPLDFAIERWNAAAGRAEIWVRVKSLVPGQQLNLYWGNPAAPAPAAAARVFDTSAGHDGVWHMDFADGAARAFLADATPNRLKTHARHLSTDSTDAALIGQAQVFNGKDGNAYAENTEFLERGGPLMLSAWVAPGFDAGDGKTHTLLAKWEPNDSAGYILDFPVGDSIRLTLGFGPAGVVRLTAGVPNPTTWEWRHAAASFDGAEAVLWWDGKAIARRTIAARDLPRTKRDIVIGGVGDADPEQPERELLMGRIDEARAGRIVRGAAWMALESATQRPGASALRLQKLR